LCDYAREKWPLKGSEHADILYRFQVSGVRFQYLTLLFPDTRHLKPSLSYNMLSEKPVRGLSIRLLKRKKVCVISIRHHAVKVHVDDLPVGEIFTCQKIFKACIPGFCH
jgi:hypothetical protein